jgi:hypothetical protein
MDAEPTEHPAMPTYAVTDHRTLRRRTHQQKAPAGDSEHLAAQVIAYTTGQQVVIQDDGSQDAMPDLRIEYPDRAPGFAEVVADMDPAYGLMWDKTIRAAALPLPGLNRVWHLTVTPACATHELRAVLPQALAALTAKGLTFDHHHDEDHLHRLDDHEVVRLVTAGVVGIDSRPVRAGEQAGVSLGPQGVSGPFTVEWDPVQDWLDGVLVSSNLADVRSKLAATGAAERHAVIGVTSSSPGEAVFALSRWHSSLPGRPPQLPAEITHLWLLGSFADRHLAWYPEYDWFNTQRRLPGLNA